MKWTTSTKRTKIFPNFVVFFSSCSKTNVYKARFIEIPLYNEFNLFLKEIPAQTKYTLMGEGFMGVHTPFTIFFISDFVLQDTKKIFCKCYQNYLRHIWLEFFIFQMSGRWFPWHPKGVVYNPHKSRGVFSDILATATRLNTSYGLET